MSINSMKKFKVVDLPPQNILRQSIAVNNPLDFMAQHRLNRMSVLSRRTEMAEFQDVNF